MKRPEVVPLKFASFQFSYLRDDLLKKKSLDEHLHALELIAKKIRQIETQKYSINDEDSPPYNVYKLGTRTSNYHDNFKEIKSQFEELNSLNIQELSALRLELEYLIDLNFRQHLQECEYLYEFYITQLYYQSLELEIDIVSDITEQEFILLETVSDEIFSGAYSVLRELKELIGVDNLKEAYKSSERAYFQLMPVVEKTFLKLDKRLKSNATKIAQELCIKHIIVQEVLYSKVVNIELSMINKLKVQEENRLINQFSTTKGKLEEIERYYREHKVTYKQAFKTLNKMSERLIGSKLYSSFESYRSAKHNYYSKMLKPPLEM